MGLFFNRKPREEAIPEQFPAPVQLPESHVELQNLIVTPDARINFPDINRDMVLGFVDKNELAIVRSQSNLTGLFRSMCMYSAESYFFHNNMGLINSSRSKNGFERKMFNTSRAIYGKEQDSEQKKKPFI